jgi:hypothetical protein
MRELLSLSLAETDPVKRHVMYCGMQTLIHNGSGMIIPAFRNYTDDIASNVMGMPTVPLEGLGGRNGRKSSSLRSNKSRDKAVYQINWLKL